MARRCSVCDHAQRAEIDRALVSEGASIRDVAGRFNLGRSAVARHKDAHIPAALADAVEQERLDEAVDLMAELRACIDRVKLMVDATDRWLRDPDDPDQYDIGARAEDVDVIYTEPAPNGKGRLRRKAKLSTLLERIEADKGRGWRVESVETKYADPRELLLKALARMDGHLTLVAKLAGELDERAQVNITVAPAWVELRAVILGALSGHPEALEAVVEALGDGDDR